MIDPWRSLTPPADSRNVSAIRCSATGQWDFFWGIDSAKRPSLLLQFSPGSAEPKWPELRGVEVVVETIDSGRTRRLILRLSEPDLRDVFSELCRDVIERAEVATSQEIAIATVCGRLWRWHYLLRGGRGRLSIQQQAGLWAEIRFLRYAGGLTTPSYAVASWKGPLHSTHDFEFERATVEVKAAFGARTSAIRISSEFQLVPQDTRALYLYVLRVAARDTQTATSTSLDQLVAETEEQLKANPAVLAKFQQLVTAAGYDPGSGYPQQLDISEEPNCVRVTPDFPALRSDNLPAGVRSVQYSLGLEAITTFPNSSGQLKSFLTEEEVEQ